mgnify:CR=1 FL=1
MLHLLSNTKKILLLTNYFNFVVQGPVLACFCIRIFELLLCSSPTKLAKSPFYKEFSLHGCLDGGGRAFL